MRPPVPEQLIDRIAGGLSAIRPLHVRAASKFRLNADSIIDGVANPLLAVKISLGGLHRYMSEQRPNPV